MSNPYSRRPIILTFVRYYLPGYKSGGPIRTIANIVEMLGDEFDFRIVTSDRDATDTEPYSGLADGEWKKVGKAHVRYLSPSQKGLRRIAAILRETPHDVLYLNSFFDPEFTQKPLLARRLGLSPKIRCVIAPRGEFSQGALKLKAGKKKAFLLATRAVRLYRELEWQASSEREKTDIRRTLGSIAQNIRIAVNLPDRRVHALPPFVPCDEGEPLRIVFLSRISPMKNLDFALDVLREVKVPVTLDIYGPIRDDAYWLHCEDLMSRLPNSVQAVYRGSVEHDDVGAILSRHDLFFLPTLGENYGHVIFESLAAGTPVLIADTTPWRNLADAGVGWDFPLKRPQAFADSIETMARLCPAEIVAMRRRALSFADTHRSDREAVEATRRLFFTEARAP